MKNGIDQYPFAMRRLERRCRRLELALGAGWVAVAASCVIAAHSPSPEVVRAQQFEVVDPITGEVMAVLGIEEQGAHLSIVGKNQRARLVLGHGTKEFGPSRVTLPGESDGPFGTATWNHIAGPTTTEDWWWGLAVQIGAGETEGPDLSSCIILGGTVSSAGLKLSAAGGHSDASLQVGEGLGSLILVADPADQAGAGGELSLCASDGGAHVHLLSPREADARLFAYGDEVGSLLRSPAPDAEGSGEVQTTVRAGEAVIRVTDAEGKSGVRSP